MTLPHSVCEVLREHVVLESECIDRMYLNVYVPQLQRTSGVVGYLRGHLGQRFASTAGVAPKTEAFVADIERFVRDQNLEMVSFAKHQRKDDVTQQHLKKFNADEGVLYVGRAQEKARVVRTERRRSATTGMSSPWVVDSSAMVNHYYFYCVDEDFGPFFLKFCSYFPYNAKLCINGNEYAKCQLRKRGIAFEALDNGILSCEDPKALQHICDGLNDTKIDGLLRKWLARLPHPFDRSDREAGYRYTASILQAEFALTQVLDRPVSGRIFFEQVIRENLDIGRPEQVQLIFNRRVTRRTPGRFRTRVITEGVTHSLHVDYKRSRIKQYHKEGQALRTQTTINDTRDFGVGRLLKNLPELRRIGLAANRRLLEIEQISHDCALGEDAFQHLQRPSQIDGQRVSALRFGDANTQAILNAVLMFVFVASGFTNKDLRQQLAVLLGKRSNEISPGRMSYELRRLRLLGLIERLPKTHRYRLTNEGLRTAMFYTRVYSRILRPVMAPPVPVTPTSSQAALRQFQTTENAVNSWCDKAHITA
ncbi:MAG: hypothetical protein IPH35_18680 [Rhodoferax sp.]|nr:hypothetical protein [Rhodoferax sp.]